jgi:hypothetical protein
MGKGNSNKGKETLLKHSADDLHMNHGAVVEKTYIFAKVTYISRC